MPSNPASAASMFEPRPTIAVASRSASIHPSSSRSSSTDPGRAKYRAGPPVPTVVSRDIG